MCVLQPLVLLKYVMGISDEQMYLSDVVTHHGMCGGCCRELLAAIRLFISWLVDDCRQLVYRDTDVDDIVLFGRVDYGFSRGHIYFFGLVFLLYFFFGLLGGGNVSVLGGWRSGAFILFISERERLPKSSSKISHSLAVSVPAMATCIMCMPCADSSSAFFWCQEAFSSM